jgi:hypothetical protein
MTPLLPLALAMAAALPAALGQTPGVGHFFFNWPQTTSQCEVSCQPPVLPPVSSSCLFSSSLFTLSSSLPAGAVALILSGRQHHLEQCDPAVLNLDPVSGRGRSSKVLEC